MPRHSTDGQRVQAAPDAGGPLRGAALCTHCGYCLPHCPTYRVENNELLSPRGRVSMLLALQAGELSEAEVVRALDSCLGCRACHPACPAGVKPGKLVVVARGRAPLAPPPITWLLHRLTDRHDLTAWVSRLLGLYQWSGLQWLVRHARLLHWAPRWAGWENLLPVRRRISRRWRWRQGGVRPRVALFSGCIGRLLQPAVGHDSRALLEALGYEVVTPGGFGCCGAPHREQGERAAFLAQARAVLERFRPHLDGVTAVVCDSTVCLLTLHSYGKALARDATHGPLAAQMAALSVSLSQFLVQQGAAERLTWGDPGLGNLVLHDHCQARHGLGIMSEPRALLAALPVALVELPRAERCCGAGGDYLLRQPVLSQAIRADKLAAVRESGADTVVAENPGCLLNLEAGWRESAQAGRPVRWRHLAEVLWGACRAGR